MADDIELDTIAAENARLMAELQKASEDEGRTVTGTTLEASPEAEAEEMRHTIEQLKLRIDELERHKTVLNESSGTGSTETCTTSSPTTIGSAAEGSETASSTTWAVASGAVEVWITSRVGYFEVGGMTLYGYARKLTFNSCGKLTAIGAETRYTIDVPEA